MAAHGERAIGCKFLQQGAAAGFDRQSHRAPQGFFRLDALGDRIAGDMRYERQADQRLVEMNMTINEGKAKQAAGSIETRHCGVDAGGRIRTERGDPVILQNE